MNTVSWVLDLRAKMSTKTNLFHLLLNHSIHTKIYIKLDPCSIDLNTSAMVEVKFCLILTFGWLVNLGRKKHEDMKQNHVKFMEETLHVLKKFTRKSIWGSRQYNYKVLSMSHTRFDPSFIFLLAQGFRTKCWLRSGNGSFLRSTVRRMIHVNIACIVSWQPYYESNKYSDNFCLLCQ